MIFSHRIGIKYAGKEIEGSPFVIQSAVSGEAKKCKFVDNAAEKVIFGKKNRLTVDAREAGDGFVTCTIKSENGKWVDWKTILRLKNLKKKLNYLGSLKQRL